MSEWQPLLSPLGRYHNRRVTCCYNKFLLKQLRPPFCPIKDGLSLRYDRVNCVNAGSFLSTFVKETFVYSDKYHILVY